MTNEGTPGTGDSAGTLLESNADPQRSLRRSLLVNGPLALLSLIPLGMSLQSLLVGNMGALLPLSILSVVTGSLAYQVYSAKRDLQATPEETTGSVRRVWSKGAVLWMVRSHYILIGRAIFVIDALSAYDLKEGDVVRVRHLPHTSTVIELRVLHREPTPANTERPGRGFFGRR
ncbi:MAG: hypothetical protein DWI59_01600 [Chloroflexi bacterium]|nr:MAG: hypothetical protein DWI59_01600 [Chloroflexota bacterium]